METPPESSYQLWLHDCIKRYFELQGFNISSITVTQQQEKEKPFDIQFEVHKDDFAKRFGFQIKRPYINGRGIYWKLQSNQHNTIQEFPWIYYAFPIFIEADMQDVACHHFIVSGGNFGFQHILRQSDKFRYFRWGGFVESLKRCPVGERIRSGIESLKTIDIIHEYQFQRGLFIELNLTQRKGFFISF